MPVPGALGRGRRAEVHDLVVEPLDGCSPQFAGARREQHRNRCGRGDAHGCRRQRFEVDRDECFVQPGPDERLREPFVGRIGHLEQHSATVTCDRVRYGLPLVGPRTVDDTVRYSFRGQHFGDAARIVRIHDRRIRNRSGGRAKHEHADGAGERQPSRAPGRRDRRRHCDEQSLGEQWRIWFESRPGHACEPPAELDGCIPCALRRRSGMRTTLRTSRRVPAPRRRTARRWLRHRARTHPRSLPAAFSARSPDAAERVPAVVRPIRAGDPPARRSRTSHETRRRSARSACEGVRSRGRSRHRATRATGAPTRSVRLRQQPFAGSGGRQHEAPAVHARQ